MLRRIKPRYHPFILMITQFLSYTLIIINTRAYNQKNYLITIVSDIFFGLYGFFIIKAVSDTNNKYSWLGYTIGGAIGSAAGIKLSEIILGQ